MTAKTCPICKGECGEWGHKHDGHFGKDVWEPCERCDGSGFVIDYGDDEEEDEETDD